MDETGLVGYLDRMEEQLRRAREPSALFYRVEALARLQRLSGWALRAAIAECRATEPELTWRRLAVAAQMPFGTLYRQYQAGGRLVVSDPTPPTEQEFEVLPSADGDGQNGHDRRGPDESP